MVMTKMNWSGPNCDFLPKWITFGPDQFILVVTISFWSWPNHYGQVQINLVRPKPFWTDQNCFGDIEEQGIRAFHQIISKSHESVNADDFTEYFSRSWIVFILFLAEEIATPGQMLNVSWVLNCVNMWWPVTTLTQKLKISDLENYSEI